MYKFCVTGEKPLVCKNPKFDEFEDEGLIISMILNYFKTYLPQVMSKKIDCWKKPIKIDPNDIDITFQKDFGKYIVILVPTEDNSIYLDERFVNENSEYAFEIQIRAIEEDSEGCLFNLIQLKSGIKTMLVNMDENLGLNTTIDGFSFDGPFTIDNSNKIVRDGAYRFSVTRNTVKQYNGE